MMRRAMSHDRPGSLGTWTDDGHVSPWLVAAGLGFGVAIACMVLAVVELARVLP